MVNIIEMPATKRYESGAIAGLSEKTIYEMNRSGLRSYSRRRQSL